MAKAIYLGYDYEVNGNCTPSNAWIWLDGNNICCVTMESNNELLDTDSIDVLSKLPNKKIVSGNKEEIYDVVFSDIANYEQEDVQKLWEKFKTKNGMVA